MKCCGRTKDCFPMINLFETVRMQTSSGNKHVKLTGTWDSYRDQLCTQWHLWLFCGQMNSKPVKRLANYIFFFFKILTMFNTFASVKLQFLFLYKFPSNCFILSIAGYKSGPCVICLFNLIIILRYVKLALFFPIRSW